MNEQSNKFLIHIYQEGQKEPKFTFNIDFSLFQKIIRMVETSLNPAVVTHDPELLIQDLDDIEIINETPGLLDVSEDTLDQDIILIDEARLPEIVEDSIEFSKNAPSQDDFRLVLKDQALADRLEDNMQNLIKIIVRNQAFEKIKEHARQDPSMECGGVMLGMFRRNQEGVLYVLITGFVRALKAVRKAASVNFSPETWAEIWRSIDADKVYSDDQTWSVVGWYHTHPRFGIFLSSFDLFIHEMFFTRPGHIALVVDPVNKTHGFFSWNKAKTRVNRWDDGVQQVEYLDDAALLKMLAVEFDFHVDQLPKVDLQESSDPGHGKEKPGSREINDLPLEDKEMESAFSEQEPKGSSEAETPALNEIHEPASNEEQVSVEEHLPIVQQEQE